MKVFQKSVPLGHDFLQVVEFFYQKCEGGDFCLFVETAKKIWFRRNKLIHEGLFTHLSDVAWVAIRAVEDYDKLR
jgi:hypothetical protein